MPQFHRSPLVVPTDYSPSSLGAVGVARSIADSDSDVTVVHVAPDYDLMIPDYAWGSDSIPGRDKEKERERLQQWANTNKLGNVRLEVRMGDPGIEVCQLAKDLDCQLLIVPSHGLHGLKRILLGSVAERIIRHCACSVLVLRRTDTGKDMEISEPWLPRKRVVVPVDFSKSSPLALAIAREVTDSPENITALNVLELVEENVLIGSEVVTSADLRNYRRESLGHYLSKHGHSSIHAHAVSGDPGMSIVKHAEDVNADLIVMPTHGRHGMARMILGSTTERVIRHSTVPVLVLRRHDAE